ncbi:hypothetical protein RRF57_003981 [Xylaria bambusicola]|uniref:Uncharacterized protein n=1 Tax=Xylaria bambusicola TaxID=326684 RepID=A0AAN7Z824_9PEZI
MEETTDALPNRFTKVGKEPQLIDLIKHLVIPIPTQIIYQALGYLRAMSSILQRVAKFVTARAEMQLSPPTSSCKSICASLPDKIKQLPGGGHHQKTRGRTALHKSICQKRILSP